MKKPIPKFDQKAWDEKQAKVAEEANGGTVYQSPVMMKPLDNGFLKALKEMEKKNKDWLDSQVYGAFLPPVPKDKLSAQFPPQVKITNPALTPVNSYPWTQYKPTFPTLSDPLDNLIFNGGEDGDRDYKLPQGIGQYTYGEWVNGSDPVFKQEERCCKPEDRTNIGFMMDKWACKICGKDME